MMKQRWRKLIKSIVENHVDPEQEKISGIRTEIDGKLGKILGFLEEVDGNDDKKESIGCLIEDFRNHYESLYECYDHLTKELKEEFHVSSSSSSDSSDSDDSSKKNGKRADKVKNKIEENAIVVEQDECENTLLDKSLELIQLKEENLLLQTRSSEMEKTLIEKEDEISNLKKKCENGENQAISQVAELSTCVNSLQEQLSVLSAQKSEADATISKQSGEISGLLIQIEKLIEELSHAGEGNAELVNKIVEYERKLKEQTEQVILLKNTEKDLKSSKEEVEQVQEQIRKVMDSRNQDINQLEDTIEDLKTDLEIKEDEINTLMENMRTTEVKQRLTSQKLRITEQVLADTEETHLKRVEMLVEEKRVLEDINASMSTYIKAQEKMASEVCEKMNETVMGIDRLSVKFEEDFGHLESRIYEITNEFKVVMNWITSKKTEQNQLKQKIERLIEHLKEEKDERYLLKNKMEVLQGLLQNGEDEMKRLIQTVERGEENIGELEKVIVEKDGQMGELERKMSEKDSEIFNLNEEKRDAIKQLCIRIDYYQTRYEDLRDMVLKARGAKMQNDA